MTIALYYSPGACSLAPHIILNDIGEPFELKKFATSEGANFSAEYQAINPKALIPALQFADFILTENPAILAFLGRQFPEAGLYPLNNPEAEARCLELLAWSSNTVHVAFAQLFRPERFILNEQDYALVKNSGEINFKKCLSTIEKHLKKQNYALGSNYSVVDPFWLVFYRWGVLAGFNMKDLFPAYTVYAELLCQRDSVQQALSIEKISILA